MTVSDISADSLEKARFLISMHNLADRADFRIADGLSALEEPAQAVAICGIGGIHAAEILKRGNKRLCGARLILSVNTDLPYLRRALSEIGYIIRQERAVTAAGRYYVVMQAETGSGFSTDREYYLGPQLQKCENEVSFHYYRHLYHTVLREKGERAVLCRRWIEEVLSHAAGNSTDGS